MNTIIPETDIITVYTLRSWSKRRRVRISIRARCTTLCDKVCQWLATGQWFSPSPLVSSTNKTDRHDITEILIKVALNTIKQTNKQQKRRHYLLRRNRFPGTSERFPAVYAMKQIRIYLLFPDDLCLLGDKICPNRHDEDAIYMSTDSPKTGIFATKMSQNEPTYHRIRCYGKICYTRLKKRCKVLLQEYVLHMFVDEATYLINKIFIY
jgi:hypothetical protein